MMAFQQFIQTSLHVWLERLVVALTGTALVAGISLLGSEQMPVTPLLHHNEHSHPWLAWTQGK
ncbi:MAG: hypothetical protein SFZ03_05295 [Candidatus Melainabacteria bacterium]|nr:hypothetical protein [Candidatus Melainabacteria bacterium]